MVWSQWSHRWDSVVPNNREDKAGGRGDIRLSTKAMWISTTVTAIKWGIDGVDDDIVNLGNFWLKKKGG